MKRFLTVTVMACTALSTLVAQPAMAAAPTTQQQAALDAYCLSIRAPSENAEGLVTRAVNANSIATVGGSTTSAFNAGSQHLHGGSPNIFGGFTVTVTGAATRFTFDCETENMNAHAGSGGVFPDGLQNPGQTYDVPDGSSSSTSQEDRVICISPNKNPGTWRNQNGYGGVCSYALYTSLAGKFDPVDPPTNSLPHI